MHFSKAGGKKTGHYQIGSTCLSTMASPTKGTSLTSSPGSIDSGLESSVGSDNDTSGDGKSVKKWGNCPPDANYLPPCRVCGAKASGLHYGANTCEPCKGFFRRCIVKLKKKEEYKCAKDGNCTLGKKRMSCSYCRYQKCLQVGMSHDAIKIGRYTHEKRARDITELKSKEQIQETSKNDKESYTDIHVDEPEVNQLIENLIEIQEEFNHDFRLLFDSDRLLEIQRSIYEMRQEKEKIFGSLDKIPSKVYQEFYEATGIDIDNRQERMDNIANRIERNIHVMVKFARALPGFCEIQTADQVALLKANYHEYWFLEFHRRVNTELEVVAICSEREKLGTHRKDMGTVFHTSSDTAEKNIDFMFESAARIQKTQLTAEEITLARAISLTSADRAILQDREKVEKVQWHFVNCLRYICKRTHKNPNERLWKIFDTLTQLRSISDRGKDVDSIKAQWPVMKNHPLVLELFAENIKST